MKYSSEYLTGLEKKVVRITFTDGCCIDIQVISTGHLKDGDDIVGKVLATHCPRKDHMHHEAGTFVNFKVFEIDTIVEVKCESR
jgi:hypothetical protein